MPNRIVTLTVFPVVLVRAPIQIIFLNIFSDTVPMRYLVLRRWAQAAKCLTYENVNMDV